MQIYRERAHLTAHLAALYPAVLQHGADPAEPGWPVLYIDLPTGQASWHISPDDLDLLQHVPAGVATWDGHDTTEKYARLDQATANLAASHAEAFAMGGDEWVRCSGPHCPNVERFTKAVERGWQAGHMGTWQCPNHRITAPEPAPCTCGRLAVGLEVTEAREWNPDCWEHGRHSTWWNSPEQQAERETRRANSLALQARAREARAAARTTTAPTTQEN